MSRDCCVVLSHDATGCLQFVIVVFPDHTRLLFFIKLPFVVRPSLGYDLSLLRPLFCLFKWPC